MERSKKRSDCPISCTLDILGDKWSFLIIRDMMFRDKSTYGEFLKSEEKIATNILAARLQNLEENKLIEKLEHPESRAKILYKLTPKAIDLLPVIVEMHLWADKYLPMSADLKMTMKQIKLEKDKFILKTINRLKKQIEVHDSADL